MSKEHMDVSKAGLEATRQGDVEVRSARRQALIT